MHSVSSFILVTMELMTAGLAADTQRSPGGGGAYLHFALYRAKEKPTSGAQITLSVDDIDHAHAAAVRAGAHVLHEPRLEPWGRSGRYRDLDGNVVELSQHT